METSCTPLYGSSFPNMILSGRSEVPASEKVCTTVDAGGGSSLSTSLLSTSMLSHIAGLEGISFSFQLRLGVVMGHGPSGLFTAQQDS